MNQTLHDAHHFSPLFTLKPEFRIFQITDHQGHKKGGVSDSIETPPPWVVIMAFQASGFRFRTV